MDLSAKQMKGKPKKVGTLKGREVYALCTKGGLHLIATPKGTGYEILGAGSHVAISRHLAQKHEPEVTWTELNKSDHVPIDNYLLVLPKYEEITDALRAKGIFE